MKEGLGRELVVALGWAVFVGFGIALGLALGALGSDVGADPEMILIAALIAGLGTLVVRLVMVGVRRGLGTDRSPSGTPRASAPPDDDEASAAGAPSEAEPAAGTPARRATTKRTAGKRTPAKRTATKRTPAKRSTTKRTPGSAPRKGSGGGRSGSTPRKRRGAP